VKSIKIGATQALRRVTLEKHTKAQKSKKKVIMLITLYVNVLLTLNVHSKICTYGKTIKKQKGT
jgi:hypothetical protein